MNNVWLMLGAAALILLLAYARIENLDTQVQTNKLQIANLTAASKEAATKVAADHDQADKQMQAINANAQALLSAKIPADCQASVKWALQQAKGIK